MSKHVGRKQRWTREDARRYSSLLGRVFYERKGWYALLAYRTLAVSEGDGGLPVWAAHRARLGPFKRPRNAMVALEREATVLRNRHGENVLIGNQLWGET
jgi:hypothetical protein